MSDVFRLAGAAPRFALAALLLVGCGDGAAGSLTLRANGSNEARDGIAAEATADGWAVEFDHAAMSISDIRMATAAGEDAAVQVTPVVVELVPEPSLVFEIEDIPAQRWDRFSYLLSPPTDDTRAVGVDDGIVERMREGGFSTYYEGRLIAPPGTVDAEGESVSVVPFAFGIPVRVDYTFCVAGNDGTDGVVIPVNSRADYEITWHITHLFFDSFVENSSLRVEPLAAQWDGDGPLTIDDLDVPLGGLRAIDGGPLLDDEGNPVIYIPGMTGADTLAEFVVRGRPGHFNGLEGFCMTELELLPDGS